MILRSRLQAEWLVIFAFLFSATLVVAAPQRRVVNRLSRPNEPVEIIAIKAKGKEIRFGKPFPGTNNWPGSLSFVVKNTSGKSVSWLRVALTFRKEKGGPRLVDSVPYGIGWTDIEKIRGGGPPLKPGETAEVSYPLEQYLSLREDLDGMGYPQSIAQLEVSVDQLIFEDQPTLMWIEGTMNEFQSPFGWRPVKP